MERFKHPSASIAVAFALLCNSVSVLNRPGFTEEFRV